MLLCKLSDFRSRQTVGTTGNYNMYHMLRLVTIAIDDRSHHMEGKLETDISLPYLSCHSHVNAERN